MTRDAHVIFAIEGARSFLHTDDHTTHGWLIQLIGRKRVYLWSPKQFPYHAHEPTLVELNPMEMLYIPFGWAHEVVAMDHCASVQWRHICPSCPSTIPEPQIVKGS